MEGAARGFRIDTSNARLRAVMGMIPAPNIIMRDVHDARLCVRLNHITQRHGGENLRRAAAVERGGRRRHARASRARRMGLL